MSGPTETYFAKPSKLLRGPIDLVDGFERGRFIVLEGLDGAGTTTQTQLVSEMLVPEGPEVVLTTHNPTGGQLSAQRFGGTSRRRPPSMSTRLPSRSAVIAFDHLVKWLWPNLRGGKWVVCDRYYLSTMAYQGALIGIPPNTPAEDVEWQAVDEALEWVFELNRFRDPPRPDPVLGRPAGGLRSPHSKIPSRS